MCLKSIHFLIFVAVAVVVVFVVFVAATVLNVEDQDLPPPAAPSERIKVFATFFPYYEFARNVAGDNAVVEQFIPSGVAVHDWEPHPDMILSLQDADVFVYNGLDIDPYITSIIDSDEFDHIVFVRASDGIEPLEINHDGEKEFESEVMHVIEGFEHGDIPPAKAIESIEDLLGGHGDDVHGHGGGGMQGDIEEVLHKMENDDTYVEAGFEEIARMISDVEVQASYDPHIWLDPVLARQQVNNIRDGLILADPANWEAYIRNAAAYNAELDEFDWQVRNRLSDCRLDTFVPFHNAFAYFAHQYDLRVFALSGIPPESEVTAMEMVEFVHFVRDSDIEVIFAEDLTDPRLAEIIADEAGAQVMILSTLEALTPKDAAENTTYLEKVHENLHALERALECS